jgi:hypothetical protein
MENSLDKIIIEKTVKSDKKNIIKHDIIKFTLSINEKKYRIPSNINTKKLKRITSLVPLMIPSFDVG